MIEIVYEGHRSSRMQCEKHGHLTFNVWSFNWHGRMMIVECAICGRVETWDQNT